MLRKGTLALCLISKSLHFKITAMTRTPALRLSEVVATLAWGLKSGPDVIKLFTLKPKSDRKIILGWYWMETK